MGELYGQDLLPYQDPAQIWNEHLEAEATMKDMWEQFTKKDAPMKNPQGRGSLMARM